MQAEAWADAQHDFLEAYQRDATPFPRTEVKVRAYWLPPIEPWSRAPRWRRELDVIAAVGRAVRSEVDGLNVFVYAPTIRPGARPVLSFPSAPVPGLEHSVAVGGVAVGGFGVNGNFVIETEVGVFSPIYNPKVPHRDAPPW